MAHFLRCLATLALTVTACKSVIGDGAADGGGGNEERGFATVRYGGQLGADTHYRIYGKYFDRDRGFSTTGISDDWRMRRFGGRLDWQPTCCDTLTLQGDTLSAISLRVYGNANLYNKIFEANKPMLKDVNKIYPGQSLRIPE